MAKPRYAFLFISINILETTPHNFLWAFVLTSIDKELHLRAHFVMKARVSWFAVYYYYTIL